MNTSLRMPFNTAQVEILKLFSQGLTEQQTEELRKVLIAFRFSLLDNHIKNVASEKGLTMEAINEVSKSHHWKSSQSKPENI